MTLLPVIGIIQVGAQARADRYTYIPLIGIFILLGWGGQAMVQRFTRHRWIWHVALGLTLGAFGLIAAQQIRYWKDDSSLFSHALKVTTDNAVPHEHLGHAYLAENRFREAAGEFAKGLAFQPNNLELNFGLADALDHLGRAEEALTFYQRVLQLRPHFPLADYQMAQILVRVGRPAEAIPHFLQVLKADPRDLDPDEKHGRAMANASGGNLGIILRSLHRLEEARACFETLLRTDPQNQTTYIYLGLTLSDLGKSDEAIAVLRRGLSLDPAQPVARYTLGRALLKDGKLDEASSAFREVLKLVPGNAEAIQQLKSIEAIQHTGKGTRSS
jgi:tetratricopeptide (TPR) repeat protein